MAGSPSPARTQIVFLGFHDPSGATGPLYGADDLATADTQAGAIFGAPCVVRKVFCHVIEAFDAAEVVTLQWRPTPGSATGEVDIGTYTIPISSIGARLVADFYQAAAPADVTIGTGGVNQYGIAGSFRQEANADVMVGPGGEWQLSDVGSSTAGQCNVWLEVEFLSQENEAAASTAMVVS